MIIIWHECNIDKFNNASWDSLHIRHSLRLYYYNYTNYVFREALELMDIQNGNSLEH